MARESVSHGGWRSLLKVEWAAMLAILLGGVLLQSMNVLLLATVLPSVVEELGGVAMLSWPTTASLASSIVAASCSGLLAAKFGPRNTYCVGVLTFGFGAVFCSLAKTMGWLVVGRLVQGFGGGLEAAVAYVIVRGTFPEAMWSRVIALMSGSWSMSVLIGPLVGGLFARFGNWRGAFIATAIVAVLLAVSAVFVLPPLSGRRSKAPAVPTGRVALICLAIASTSCASIVAAPIAKTVLIAAAVGILVVMLKLDRAAATPLLPRDAFSLQTPTGVGLWLALLLCITFSPLQLYVPLFLQRLHGLDPLAAGFVVASGSMGWTIASLVIAGASGRWPDRLMLAGPPIMGIGLIGIAVLMPLSTFVPLIVAIMVLGIGIGQCWPLVAHRIMSGARAGDEATTAAAVPTVQQMGFALGAALAGVAANASGLSGTLTDQAVAQAALWVPVSFVAVAATASLASLRLSHVRQA
ncbi:Major Facilitator Superfamily protein [Enhydrobacter aerosaccus]|uniref:Major Facilitator Superfamily protein n=1 Tax=Enhydrobacter aerosaccus TaxID=225324 RepID=A0A1T4KH86_9HYPH|nr:MFS transporter [Enhydrobacter aerosaccus]SJZ41736.1 Major Facilitator Superfamily protein [Enhydrobacter aerosaccus]